MVRRRKEEKSSTEDVHSFKASNSEADGVTFPSLSLSEIRASERESCRQWPEKEPRESEGVESAEHCVGKILVNFSEIESVQCFPLRAEVPLSVSSNGFKQRFTQSSQVY